MSEDDDAIARNATRNMDHVVDTIDMTEHDSLGQLIEQQDGDKQERQVVDPDTIADDLDSDFERARQNLMELAEEGALSLSDLNQIARASQHPRAFEVVATMIDKLNKLNNDLVELHERKHKARTQQKKNEGEVGDTVVNQTYNDNRTIKTTAELVHERKGKT